MPDGPSYLVILLYCIFKIRTFFKMSQAFYSRVTVKDCLFTSISTHNLELFTLTRQITQSQYKSNNQTYTNINMIVVLLSTFIHINIFLICHKSIIKLHRNDNTPASMFFS